VYGADARMTGMVTFPERVSYRRIKPFGPYTTNPRSVPGNSALKGVKLHR
jgi:hypothetical protein